MECTNRPLIDYEQAAERLLVALSFIARKLPGRPVPAAQLCVHAFDLEVRRPWSHETRRRRVRDAVVVARKQLAERTRGMFCTVPNTIAANGEGYWITAEAAVIKWYAERRRRRGLGELVQASKTKQTLANAGQENLFVEPPDGVRGFDAGKA